MCFLSSAVLGIGWHLRDSCIQEQLPMAHRFYKHQALGRCYSHAKPTSSQLHWETALWKHTNFKILRPRHFVYFRFSCRFKVTVYYSRNKKNLLAFKCGMVLLCHYVSAEWNCEVGLWFYLVEQDHPKTIKASCLLEYWTILLEQSPSACTLLALQQA